jgi:transposase-like protein
MPKHKSEDFKLSAVEYYLTEDVSQEQVCKIFKCLLVISKLGYFN